MYGGGDAACRRILVGELSEEWLMMIRVWESGVDGGFGGGQQWFISCFLDMSCGVLTPLCSFVLSV